MDETGARDAFTRMGTLGIEEEFYVVDDHGRPTSGTDELVYERDPPALLDGRLDHELFKCIIETQTPILESPGEAHESVAAVREALVDHARSNGFAIAAAGLHPLAHWRELEQAEKPRYRSQLDRIQYPQHRNITAGLHVHVGVDDADKATWIANEVRWYLPMLLALSANSPFWNGFDTGLASARAKLFEALPNTGIPTAFDSYASFHRFEQRMVQTGRIKDRGELWFDVRPHSGHGTVEIRTPDSQRDVATVMAFVEYVHALVEDLANRYDEGASGTDIRREFIDENRWRAIRYGHDADLVARDCSRTISLGELVDRECARLGVRGIGSLVEKESGATLQRRLWEEDTATALGNELKL